MVARCDLPPPSRRASGRARQNKINDGMQLICHLSSFQPPCYSTMSAFILAPAPTAPQSAELHLLPFSLPASTSSSTISAYFQPREAPPSHAAQGCLLASFRGRQVVGQKVAIPKGYKGVVLRATGSTSDTASSSVSEQPRYPLTPASSIASTGEPAPSTGGRTRGANQTALARPRRRAAVTRARIALDESEDEDEEHDVVAPRKKARVATPEPVNVPDINIVQATPAKASADDEDEELHDNDATLAPATVTLDEDVKIEKLAPAASAQEYASDGRPARVLAPVGSFESFTLWTPDAPLAGYARGVGAASGGEAEAEGKEGGEEEGEKGKAGWWSATGGGGEGGDEFVRALGEWLGLCEIVSCAQAQVADGRFMRLCTAMTATATATTTSRTAPWPHDCPRLPTTAHTVQYMHSLTQTQQPETLYSDPSVALVKLLEPRNVQEVAAHAAEIRSIARRTADDGEPTNQRSPLELRRSSSSERDDIFRQVEQVLQGDLERRHPVPPRVVVERKLEHFELAQVEAPQSYAAERNAAEE